MNNFALIVGYAVIYSVAFIVFLFVLRILLTWLIYGLEFFGERLQKRRVRPITQAEIDREPKGTPAPPPIRHARKDR